jgi:ABC-type oligopeptide transport system substrate-binding subunit
LSHYVDDKIDWCRVDDRSDLPSHYPEETFLVQYLQTVFLGFSCKYAPFNHKLMRQALARSIDQRDLVKAVWSDVQRAAMGGVVPPGVPGHSPEIGVGFDPVAARELLRQAGFGTGVELPFLAMAALPGFSTTPDYLRRTWREHLGISVRVIEDVPADELLSQFHQGSVQLALIGWDVEYPDPDNMLRVLFHSSSPVNYFGWHNRQFGQLVDRAAGLANQQERLALYHQADKILVAEDTAIVPLYYRQAYGLIRPGFRIEGSGRLIRGATFKLKHIAAI